MEKKIYYWSPFFSNIATIKAVLNSSISIKKFSNNIYKPALINVIGEWDDYKKIIEDNKIEVIEFGDGKYMHHK